MGVDSFALSYSSSAKLYPPAFDAGEISRVAFLPDMRLDPRYDTVAPELLDALSITQEYALRTLEREAQCTFPWARYLEFKRVCLVIAGVQQCKIFIES